MFINEDCNGKETKTLYGIYITCIIYIFFNTFTCLFVNFYLPKRLELELIKYNHKV